MRYMVILSLLSTTIFGFWDAGVMRPSVEPARVEILLDSLIQRGDPERGLVKMVEDSLRSSEERLKAATVLSALYNRKENPAKALLVLFYVEKETGAKWDEEQLLVAAEAYSRLGRRDWAETNLDRIPEDSYLKETAEVLKSYEFLRTMQNRDSLVYVRSRFERSLERFSDPLAIMLAVQGLGLTYVAKSTPESLDTATGYFGLIVHEYQGQDMYMPYLARLTPYSLYWSGTAANVRGDNWTALDAWEKLHKEHRDSRFWEEASVRFAAIMVRRWMPDSATIILSSLLAVTSDTHRILEARMLQASAQGLKERYDLSAETFANLLRSIPPGDTLRVLAYSGMVYALLEHSRTFFEADSIAPGLERLNLSGYNPLALPRVSLEIGERYIAERNLPQASYYLHRALEYYPDMLTETQARLDLAYVALANGEWDNTITHYERALELVKRQGLTFGGLADVRFNVGLAYLERSKCSTNGEGKADLSRARMCFREASNLDPRGETGTLARKKLEEIQ